jgi:eukaryotic-like serine/threonine-protein kinase
MAANVFKVLLADWMIGGILTLYFLVGYVADWSNLRLMENATYDLRAALRAHGQQSEQIEIIAVDQESINKVGRWPWPRSTQARLLENLRTSGAKVIAFQFSMSEPDRSSQGMEEVRAMKQRLTAQIASPQTDARQREAYVRMLQELGESETRLDQDAKFATSLGRGSEVILPINFELGFPEGESVEPSAPIAASAFSLVDNPRDMTSFPPAKVKKMTAPLQAFQLPQVGFGHATVLPDADNVVRREAVLVEYLDRFYPSFALRAVSAYLDAAPDDVHVVLGKGVKVGELWVPTDRHMRARVSFSGPAGSFKPFSAHHVLGGKIPPSTFRGKLVLVGPLAAVAGAAPYETPTAPAMAVMEITANVIQNVLSQSFLTVPRWAPAVELSVILLIGVFVVLALPRLGTKWSGIVAGTILVSYLGFVAIAYAAKGYILTVVHPTLMLVLGYTFIAAKRALLAERGEGIDSAASETNRMLGLTFQGQGMLELAFDKFRVCPIDDSMKELLYSLGQDFERKRMQNKALSVYQHIATKDRSYKDIEQRMKRLSAAEASGIGGKQSSSGSLLSDGSDVKPTLGRYEVVKELGRGAMGIVYLGKDPKIHRSVAIKTMRLDEVEADELPDVKARFFREAESAGKLSHPNIVTIYDAGEEQDLAYFAMEVLDGVDLKDLCKKRNLLPIKRTLEIVTKVSEALDYAHSQSVVHRDIKPANIMVMPDGTVKVTDFGIAKIVTTAKTQTGIVLGTPSYMSPEQLSGAKVDGRSDLFSLGVVLFEMLTGERPFQGESVATLMYVIANQPHPSPFELRPDLPKTVGTVIDRALQKDAAKRYQRGLEMAQDLRAVMQGLTS